MSNQESGLLIMHQQSCTPVNCPVCSNITVQIVYVLEEHMSEQQNIQFSGTENSRDTKNYCLVCDEYLPISEKLLMDHCQEEAVHTKNHTDISRGVKKKDKPIIPKEKSECDFLLGQREGILGVWFVITIYDLVEINQAGVKIDG
ncbi:Hypothetical predicted protein [Cloeon dipterum]|uniref:Uncharacterized protein n=1 Tax=Cloeon dipterum TaxID=197152 RepID=A0A8S1DRM2_9INSE|nr:Hypothetical predicted protein [Cloeon dipterum]